MNYLTWAQQKSIIHSISFHYAHEQENVENRDKKGPGGIRTLDLLFTRQAL